MFAALVAAFALGIWGTVVRPPAYEVRGQIVARPAPDLLLVRHEEITALGMQAMEMMAIAADPRVVDAARVGAGDRVRLAVRRRGDEIMLVRIERER